jgi:serine protease inhibitor
MPFWERFKPREVPRSKGLEEHSSSSLSDGAKFSLQSFGLALLQQESSVKLKQNVFISPLSVFLALAMTENGAAGETKVAMRKVLVLPTDASEEAVNESAVALVKSLQSQGDAKLAIANALWVDVRSTIAPDFVRVCQEIYDAAARTLDLNQPSSAVAINNWVSEKTRGKIPSIVPPNGIGGLPAILTNAIYFKGKFRIPFRKEATGPKPFYLADGREKVVPMMRMVGLPASYRSGKRFEAAVLRYKDSGIALYMLLPARGTSPEQILTEESVQGMLLAKESCELDLSMPRFTIDFSSYLKESLTQLGMGIAFQYPGADFSALGSPLFFLGEVIHKTRLEVDEEGTVAAAATAVVMDTCSGMPQPVKTKTLVFDRPFAALLRDTITGAIVFVGVVYEP